MARSYWTVETKVAGVWTAAPSLPAPNEDFEESIASTQRKVELAEGENAFFTPSTTSNFERTKFSWLADDGIVHAQVKSYIQNRTDVRITDDKANIWIGRFIDFKSTRVVGLDENEYDLDALFEIMPSIN